MNQREPVQASKGAGRAFRCLSLLLGSTLLDGNALAGLRIRIQVTPPDPVPECSQPYLPSLGPPGLRFSDPLPETVAVVSSAAAPPLPSSPPPADSPVAVVSAPVAVASSPSKPARPSAPAAEGGPDDPPAPSSASISILPDTVRPQVQAEDFLPFFVIPDAVKQSSTPPVPSEPGKLPPSTATYNQTR
jgi:hypothetical protein